jgi:hypothetical protein
MLFGPCAQDAAASFLPATSSLCAGGVGFVTAMMATLAASSRVAPAKTLGQAVPEVDRLAVHIVTDNVVIQFVPTETRDGLTVERFTAATLRPIGRHAARSTANGVSLCTPNPSRVARHVMFLSISATRRKCC